MYLWTRSFLLNFGSPADLDSIPPNTKPQFLEWIFDCECFSEGFLSGKIMFFFPKILHIIGLM